MLWTTNQQPVESWSKLQMLTKHGVRNGMQAGMYLGKVLPYTRPASQKRGSMSG